jgi:hypothetical protein
LDCGVLRSLVFGLLNFGTRLATPAQELHVRSLGQRLRRVIRWESFRKSSSLAVVSVSDSQKVFLHQAASPRRD